MELPVGAEQNLLVSVRRLLFKVNFSFFDVLANPIWPCGLCVLKLIGLVSQTNRCVLTLFSSYLKLDVMWSIRDVHLILPIRWQMVLLAVLEAIEI